METKKPFEKNKEQKTPEEKEALEKAATTLFIWLRRQGVQGNFSAPLYNEIIGKIKLELYVDPLQANKIFRLGG